MYRYFYKVSMHSWLVLMTGMEDLNAFDVQALKIHIVSDISRTSQSVKVKT